jgi:hypothetical protein
LCKTKKLLELQKLSEKIQGLYLGNITDFYSREVNTKNFSKFAKEYKCDNHGEMYDLSIAPLMIRALAALLDYRKELLSSADQNDRENAEKYLQGGMEGLIGQILEDPVNLQRPNKNELESVHKHLWAYNENGNAFEIYYTERIVEALVVYANCLPSEEVSPGRSDKPESIPSFPTSAMIPLEINIEAFWDSLINCPSYPGKILPKLVSDLQEKIKISVLKEVGAKIPELVTAFLKKAAESNESEMDPTFKEIRNLLRTAKEVSSEEIKARNKNKKDKGDKE